MSTYSSFALVGAGIVGRPVLEALLERKVSIVVLTRPGSATASKLPAGAKSVAVDLKDVAAIAAVFKEYSVEVVVSTVGAPGLYDQRGIADAAKQSGVKLFVPSEFGVPTIGETVPELVKKDEVAKYLKSIGLPSVRIFDGLFTEYIPWFVGFDAKEGKFKIRGSGKTQGSFTSIGDIAGFTAYVLTTLPPTQLANAIFRIEGEHASLLEIAALYGDKVKVEKVDEFTFGFQNVLHDKLEAGQMDIKWDQLSGKHLTGETANSNGLWKDHKWKGIKDVLFATA